MTDPQSTDPDFDNATAQAGPGPDPVSEQAQHLTEVETSTLDQARATATEAVERVQAAAADVSEKAQRAAEGGAATAGNAANDIVRTLRENPQLARAAAAGLGIALFIGVLIGRRR